jgi:hypothetical protein
MVSDWEGSASRTLLYIILRMYLYKYECTKKTSSLLIPQYSTLCVSWWTYMLHKWLSNTLLFSLNFFSIFVYTWRGELGTDKLKRGRLLLDSNQSNCFSIEQCLLYSLLFFFYIYIFVFCYFQSSLILI